MGIYGVPRALHHTDSHLRKHSISVKYIFELIRIVDNELFDKYSTYLSKIISDFS